MSALVEVHEGLWVSELYAVWFVDGKTWLLLEGGKNHWIPGNEVKDIVAKWQGEASPHPLGYERFCDLGRPLQQHTRKCAPGCNYGGMGS